MEEIAQPTNPLDQRSMTGPQVLIIAIMVVLNALDGFDILSISFAAPYITTDWGISMGTLGIVLSAELFGMAVGSIFLGNVADRIGRRPLLLICLGVMALGMYLASLATGVSDMLVYRVFTGLGIGGMLAGTNAMTAEFANEKQRKRSITIMVAGYPLGVIFGGIAAGAIVEVTGDWRDIFALGAAVSALMLPVVWLCVPESIEYLSKKPNDSTLSKINVVLKKLGHERIEALPPKTVTKVQDSKISDLFTSQFAKTTIVLTITYFMTIVTFYFILKWVPKLVQEMGFGNPGAVLVWASIGGFLGCMLFGSLTKYVPLRRLTIISLLLGFVGVVIFGQGAEDINHLKAVTAFAGFFTNAAIVGMYTMFALYFPAEIRASGTGFAIGTGRAGAFLSPIIAGFLLEWGWPLSSVAIVMGGASLIGVIMLLLLRDANQSDKAMDS
ncbi:MAG: MFS transporter [Halieaceae bacterium]|jgi:benzoate transport